MKDTTQKTIDDFGEQFTKYELATLRDSFYGDIASLTDMCGPLLELSELRNIRIAEIGAGPGRLVRQLLNICGAAHVYALEPSAAFEVLKENTRELSGKVTLLRVRGEQLPSDIQVDLVMSIGVLHHIPDPSPVVRAAYEALRPGGAMIAWVYGKENNGLYLAIVTPIRWLSVRTPHLLLSALANLFAVLTGWYAALCKFAPLPMRRYMSNVCGRQTFQERRLMIYDQLNPAYARYYTEPEICELFRAAGFENIRTWHRHKYSWTIRGERPACFNPTN